MRRLIVVTLIALALVPGVALAAPPIDAHGTFAFFPDESTFMLTPLGPGGCLLELGGTYEWYGTLEGSGPAALRIILHRACEDESPPFSSRESGHAEGTFTGTVAGRQGSFQYRFDFHPDGQGEAHGTMVLGKGTGGLAGIHGVLKFNDDFVCLECPTSTYDGWIRFAPR
jgi:hypothetical protein